MKGPDHQPKKRKSAAASATDRSRKYRERLFLEAIPPDLVFDRMLRKIIVENAANDAMTPARALTLTRDRLAQRYSLDGINSVIAKFARGSSR